MIATKAGSAVYLPVSSLSIFLLRRRSLLSLGCTTVCSHRPVMKRKRMSASAAMRS